MTFPKELPVFDEAELKRLLEQTTDGQDVSPDLAQKVSLLPISHAEATAIRAQVVSLQRSVQRGMEASLVAQQRAGEAHDLAEVAKTQAEGVQTFSGRLLALEFTVSRILETLEFNNIGVDLKAREPVKEEE